MKRPRSIQSVAAVVVAAVTIAFAGTAPANYAFAQVDVPPEASVSPPDATPEATAEATAEATVTPTETAPVDGAVQPAAVSEIVWTPGSGSLAVDGSNLAKVRVSSNEGDLDPTTAKYQLIINGAFQPEQSASAAPVGGNATLDISANVAAATQGTQIVFKITKAGGGTPILSNLYTIARSTKVSMPVIQRDSGVSTIPVSILNAGANACDASFNRRGGPLGSFVTYQATGTTTDMWFFTFNPVPNAAIVVSLTNYTAVQGQLQVYPASACGAVPATLGLGTNPNPVVSVPSLPAGVVYFRVVSGAGQAAPPPFTIRWAYQGGNSGGGTGSVEPTSSPCNSNVILKDTTYSTAIRQQYNFYALDITAPTQIRVRVNNLGVGLAQIQVRSPLGTPPDCNAVTGTQRLDPFSVVPAGGGNVLMTVGVGTSNRYYIRVSLPNGVAASGQPYTIRWEYISGSDTSTPLFTTNPVQPFNPPYNGDITGNVVEGGVFSFFWSGMNAISGGYDTLQLRIRDDIELFGCPKNTFPPDAGRTTPQGFARNFGNLGNSPPKGGISIKFDKSGSYAVAFRALRGGSQVFFDEKPLRVGCGFATLNAASTSQAGPSTSVLTETDGGWVTVGDLMTGYRMSEQDTPAPDGVEPQP